MITFLNRVCKSSKYKLSQNWLNCNPDSDKLTEITTVTSRFLTNGKHKQQVKKVWIMIQHKQIQTNKQALQQKQKSIQMGPGGFRPTSHSCVPCCARGSQGSGPSGRHTPRCGRCSCRAGSSGSPNVPGDSGRTAGCTPQRCRRTARSAHRRKNYVNPGGCTRRLTEEEEGERHRGRDKTVLFLHLKTISTM